MGKYASKMVELAQSWVGIKEGSSGHKEILAIYNSQNPLPRGYKMTTKDAWCAATTTALAVKLGYTNIVPCECSCTRLIALAKDMGIWVENESITPTPGMLCLYDWGDTSGKSDNKGDPDHIGIVESVGGGKFVVIEGNADTNRDGKDGVERRQVEVNGKNIRGFIAPKYDPEPEETADDIPEPHDYTLEMDYLMIGDEGDAVRALQILLKANGYDIGNYGKNRDGIDGIFGKATADAVLQLQIDKDLSRDKVAGPEVMGTLLGVY